MASRPTGDSRPGANADIRSMSFTFWQLVRVPDAPELTYVAKPYITIHSNMIEINRHIPSEDAS